MVLSPFGGLFQPCWSRSDGVVPFRMECVALDVERLHLGIADFDTLFVGGGVERAFDLQAGLGGRRGNQLDHGHAIDEGAPAPGLRDVAEQVMLDLIAPRLSEYIRKNR